MKSRRFSDHLRELAAPVWRAQHDHPFVRGIKDSSLEPVKFAFWMRQDYLFLIEYCRLFGLAAARAPDLGTLTRFGDLLQATARTEMGLHRAYARDLGMSEAELEREAMAPTTRAYTDFLVRIGATGDFGELAAALLPCMWGYAEIGQRLKGAGPSDGRYVRWIEMYSDPAFMAMTDWCRALVDELGLEASLPQRRRMEVAFLTSSRYEYLFWHMAWKREGWPA